MLRDKKKEIYERTSKKAGKVLAAFLRIALILLGSELAGKALLHINFGEDAISGVKAQLLALGREMLQLIFLLLVAGHYHLWKRLAFDVKKFINGLKIALPLVVVYTVLSIAGVIRLSGAVSGPGAATIPSGTEMMLKGIYYFCGVAVTEEILFRVIVTRILALTIGWQNYQERKSVILLQALLFSAMHGWKYMQYGMASTAVKSMLLSFLAGFFYGIIYVKSKSVWTTVVLHGWYDSSVWLLEAV